MEDSRSKRVYGRGPTSHRGRAIAALLVASLLATSAAACGGSDSSSAPPAEPSAGSWRTWVLSSGSQVPVPPPPAEGSPAATRDSEQLAAAVDARNGADSTPIERWDRNPAMAPWMERAMEAVSQRPKDPPYSSRAYALVAVAMYDAAVSASYWQEKYGRAGPDVDAAVEAPDQPSYPDSHAAIAAAGSRVIAHLFPEQPAERLDRDAEEAARSRVVAGVSYPSDIESGLDLGRAIADRVNAHADADGADRRWDGSRPPKTPAYYQAPPGTAGRPVQPLAGTWGTWVISSGDQFRSPPPPPYGSPGFDQAVREMIEAKENLTDEQREAALFWAGGEGTPLPAGIWEGVIIEYLADRDLSLPRAARAFALASVAMADAGVAAWDTKYAYWYPRPENAIRDSGADPNWKPLLPTPFFPAYTSGHATYSAAAAEVLSYLFPEDSADWDKRAQEAADSRVWGGIHWTFDSSEGLKAGRKVGELVVERAQEDGADQ